MANQIPLYPLRFEPIFQYRLWGGRRLQELLDTPLPNSGPFGEAWVLSDREDMPSKVANGPLKGRTVAELMDQSPEQLLGSLAQKYRKFPLLLKFLDARQVLSVQVHPSDSQKNLLPPGESGKTEAWVVLEADDKSKVYGGLVPGTTEDEFKKALNSGTSQDKLASFTPQVGDTIFIPAGTVHTMGGLVVFEVQENSDVTFRLYDWGHVDPNTGKPRELHIEQGLESITFPQNPVTPVTPLSEQSPESRERLIKCDHFTLWRAGGKGVFPVGAKDTPRIIVCTSGEGQLEHGDSVYRVRKGEVWLLPANVGKCDVRPRGGIQLLEIGLP